MGFLTFSRQYVGQDYGTKKNIAGGKITLDQIDAVNILLRSLTLI